MRLTQRRVSLKRGFGEQPTLLSAWAVATTNRPASLGRGAGGRNFDVCADGVLPAASGVATLSIQVHELADSVTFQVSGELDFFDAGRLRAAVEGLRLDGRRRVALDLAGLTFCDAGGVNALLAVHRWIRSQGGQLHVQGVSGLPRRVLSLTEADKLLNVD